MYGNKKHNKIGLEFVLDSILFVFIITNQTILLLQSMTFVLAIPWVLLFLQGAKSFDK